MWIISSIDTCVSDYGFNINWLTSASCKVFYDIISNVYYLVYESASYNIVDIIISDESLVNYISVSRIKVFYDIAVESIY